MSLPERFKAEWQQMKETVAVLQVELAEAKVRIAALEAEKDADTPGGGYGPVA